MKLINSILISIAILFIGFIGYFTLLKPGLIDKVPISQAGIIRVTLVDAFSGQLISNANVKIHSDNGIRCFTGEPCNTEGQEWIGKSNSAGIISIPSKIINVDTSIFTDGYSVNGGDLNIDSEKISKDNLIIELDPDSKIDNLERRLKLIDSQTQKPLANTTVWIINSQNCLPPQCRDYSFTGITNSLGNVYFSISSLKNINWIFVNNYEVVKYTGWRNIKVFLDKKYIQNTNLKEKCESYKGQWSPEYQECVAIPEEDCQKLGGTYNGCESACRHSHSKVCIAVCVQVCKF